METTKTARREIGLENRIIATHIRHRKNDQAWSDGLISNRKHEAHRNTLDARIRRLIAQREW